MGTCVAQRNHQSFFIHGWSTNFLALYTLTLNVTIMFRSREAFESTHPFFNKLIVPCIILSCYGLIISILLFCLTCFHTYLVVNNETTQEYIRDKYFTWDGNPYDFESLMKNLRYFWLK